MNNYILPTYNRIKLEFLHGKGSWLYTKYDRYLDFSSGIEYIDLLIKFLALWEIL